MIERGRDATSTGTDSSMPTDPDPHEDPAITGVPPETPERVRPSATGVVAGPLDDDTSVQVEDVDHGAADRGEAGEAFDRTLEDAAAGVEGSTLDAPDD
jgi:hypothetical protein